MIDRVECLVHLKPNRLLGDTAYGAAPLLNWIVNEKMIEPSKAESDRLKVPSSRLAFSHRGMCGHKSKRMPTLGARSLRPRGRATAADTLLLRAANSDYAGCVLKQRCCPNTPHRKITRSVYEDARDAAHTVCASPADEQSRKDRKKVEMLFAHLKRILKLGWLRLRGIKGARGEFLMAAAVQNLRRMTSCSLRGRKWEVPIRRDVAHYAANAVKNSILLLKEHQRFPTDRHP